MDANNSAAIKEKKEIKPKHLKVLHNYIDIDNPNTYGNKTQSYIQEYKTATIDSARSAAARLFAKDNIRAELEKIIKEENIGIKERVAELAKIIHGTSVRTVITNGKDGAITTTYEPSAHEKIKAIKELNQIEGIQDRVRHQLDAQAQTVGQLRKLYFKEILKSKNNMRDVTPDCGQVKEDNGVVGLRGVAKECSPSSENEEVKIHLGENNESL